MRGTLKAQGRSLDRSTYINQKPNMAAPLGGVGGCKLCCGECPCLHPPPLPPKQRTLKTNFKIFGTNSKDPIISLVQGPKKSRTTFLIPPTKEEGGRCTLGLPFLALGLLFSFWQGYVVWNWNGDFKKSRADGEEEHFIKHGSSTSRLFSCTIKKPVHQN